VAQVSAFGARAWLLPLLLLASCTGSLENPAGPGAPSASPGRTGASDSTDGGGASSQSDGASALPKDPGVVTMRRLNHVEYNNTVRDLLGTQLKPADEFPADDLGGGFDTVGSALSLSPAYVLAYERSAHALVEDTFADAARRARLIPCDVDGDETCARSVVDALARKAFRRPVTAAEVDALMLPVNTAQRLGATRSDGLKHALAAVLLSPLFLFKSEVHDAAAGGASQRLTSHQVATRLSYALWSTMPDEPLSAAADRGELATEAQIGAQIERMLTDRRADALLDTFAAQWLEYANLSAHEVERNAFPRYTPALARSMQLEARRFVEEFLRSSAPVEEMLTARFTFVDAALATHYGLPAPPRTTSNPLTRVDTSAAPRSGLLTLGAFLTATSFSARTSPVKRGDFVFSQLLCGTIAPPPPDVPALPEGMDSLTLRERLEQHRENPSCAACHNLMDPIGFGLEQYDAIGSYRMRDGTAEIDATGMLPNGDAFDGALELSALLAADPRFPRCVTKKFLTFAAGRLLDRPADNAWVEQLAKRAQADGGSLKSIIRAVLLSDVFLSRANM
jgi:hypothetical protein